MRVFTTVMTNERVRNRFYASVLLIFCIGGVLLNPCYAGTGKVIEFSAVDKQLDFCVSIRFTATNAQINNIQRAFTDANEVLADATDGQYKFNQIDIVNNSGASRQAEVWILPGTGGAYATCGLYGTPGEHIVMYYDSNFVGNPALDGDAYTVAHEFAHHLWGVKDEYSGPSGVGDCEAVPGSPTASFCLMDNYFTRGGNSGAGTTYTLNELCVFSNHDPDMDTHQENKWMQSCWERLASHPSRSAVAPVALPTDAAPAVAAPRFRLPATDRRFVVCVDRSGSMELMDGGPGTESRLDLAKQGAGIFVSLTKIGDRIGITSFATGASTDFPLTEIVVDADRVPPQNAVNALVASGLTAIGSGLIASRNLLTGQPFPSCAQTIILLTDGEGNVDPPELSVVPSLVAEDISVITIAIGAAPVIANLQTIANQTGGKFFQVASAAELPALLAALSAEASGGGVLARQPGFVAEGETQTIDVLVDEATGEATFTLTWQSSADDLDLILESPSGNVITSGDAAGNSDVKFIPSTNTEILLVGGNTLEPGVWKARVVGTTVAGGGSFDFVATSDNEGVSLTVATDKPEYTFPEPITVMATPRFDGQNVVGAEVMGTVVRPDGTTVNITLLDNGNPANADDQADDGVYSALFTSFSTSGAYSFDLTVTNATGQTFGGESLFQSIGVPVNSQPVPSFTRTSNATAVVKDVVARVPCDIDGDNDVDRDDLNLILAARNTPATGADDPRDVDGDGMITVLDARKCVLSCDRAGCATE